MSALPHESPTRVRWATAAIVVGLWQPLLLILFVVGSLVLTGAQALPDQVPPYGQVMPFPVFPVPALLLLLPAIALLAAAVWLVFTSRLLDAPRIVGMLGPVAGSAVATLFFLAAQPGGADQLYLVSLLVNGGSLVVLIIGVIRFVPTYDRLRRAQELPEGYP